MYICGKPVIAFANHAFKNVEERGFVWWFNNLESCLPYALKGMYLD